MMVVVLMTCQQLVAQDGYEVKKILFEGNKTFERGVLLSKVSMHEVGLWSKWVERKPPYIYQQEFIENDQERLVRFYQSEGFVAVQVQIDTLKVQHRKKELQLRVKIVENQPYTVAQTSIQLPDTIVAKKRMEKALRLKIQLDTLQRFSDARLHQDLSTISRHLHTQGYPYAQTTYRIELDTLHKTIDIDYLPTLGALARFGKVHIRGERYTKKSYLTHQILFDEGDIYRTQQLDKTRKSMYRLQQFRIVSLSPRLSPDQQTAPIPIDLVVEEMPRLSTTFGVGWGTEDQLRAFADVTYRGLLRDASRLNLYVKHSALEPYHVSLKLIQPQFLDKQTALTLHPYLMRQIEPGYDTQRLGLNIPIQHTFTDYLQGSLGYYYEKVMQSVERGDSDIPNLENNTYLYDKSGLTLHIAFDNARPQLSPKQGWKTFLRVKYNGFLFPSDFDYIRLWLDVRRYQPVGTFSLALRGAMGAVYTNQTDGFVPVEDRFYAGGSNSIRGWSRAMVGPKRPSGTPLGGNSMVEMSAEIRHHLFWRLSAALFVDAGNVWKKRFDYSLGEMVYASGGGLRLDTPIGPIRFDVGFPLWNEKKKPQFFISIGQPF